MSTSKLSPLITYLIAAECLIETKVCQLAEQAVSKPQGPTVIAFPGVITDDMGCTHDFSRYNVSCVARMASTLVIKLIQWSLLTIL